MTFKDGKFEDTVTVSTVPAGQSPTHPLSDAMKEQGFMDLGYGDIRDRSTLIDTFTGGMNVLTGLTSEHVKTPWPGCRLCGEHHQLSGGEFDPRRDDRGTRRHFAGYACQRTHYLHGLL